MRQINYYTFYIIVLLSLITTSCSQQLGNNLLLWEGDRKEDRVITYCTSPDFGDCISGIYVVPNAKRNMVNNKYAEYVLEAFSNKNWVVAKTQQIKENRENYYIINKAFNIENINCAKVNCDSIIQSYVIGPLSIDKFNEKKQSLNIDLDFK